MMLMTNTTTLVTGGTRGIGRAIAARLIEEGHQVIITGRYEPGLLAAAEELGATPMQVDLADRESLQTLLHRLATEVGRIDVLINNAGVTDTLPFGKVTDTSWDHLVAVNLTAPMILSRALVPEMLDAGFGRVVFVSSVSGLTGFAYASTYCATKHGVVGYMRALAKELAAAGSSAVTANAICPAWVATDMASQVVERIVQKTGRDAARARNALAEMCPQKRMLAPEEVAHVVATLCHIDARGINGETIAIDGGQIAA
jgi:3-hydroxybutyrate dehydrogenase